MKEIDLKNVKKAYFIGIGGIGMSAVARMLLHEGKQVLGSDAYASKITDELAKLGADLVIDTPTGQFPDDVDLVIYTVAVPEDHPQLVYARAKGIPTISYPESLGLISKDKYTIAVAGTHGKTTTTAMVAQILIDAGLDPTVIVGSLLKSGTNFVPGKSKYFVVEACEYKRSFLNIKPDIAIITNIDDDHLDYYKDMRGIQKGFSEFISGIKADGILITNPKDKNIAPILSDFEKKVFDYTNIDEALKPGVPGDHNVRNAKAAFIVSQILSVPRSKAIASIGNFTGTWRRFEKIGETKTGALVYDDYGHHPTEIAATMQAAKEKFPNERIVVAFQPHLYSRTKEHLKEFGPALSRAHEILVLPIYAAREPKDESVSSEILAQEMQKEGVNAKAFESFEVVADYLKTELKKGDVFMTIGAGDINKLAKILVS